MFRSPNFKHADTQLLAAFGVLYIGAVAGGWVAFGAAAALAIGLGLVLLLVSGLLLHLHRERQAEVTHALDHVHGLLSVHTLLEPRAPLPGFTRWAASAEFCAALTQIVLDRQPRRVLELGSGTSSVVLGYALERAGGGRLLSLDHDAVYAEKTRQHLRRHGLDDRADVLHAPLETQSIDGRQRPWYHLPDAELDGFVADGGIDLLVVDGPPRESDPEARYPALPLLLDRLAPDAVLVLDDADRAEEQAALARWQSEVPGLTVETIASARGIAVVRRSARPTDPQQGSASAAAR